MKKYLMITAVLVGQLFAMDDVPALLAEDGVPNLVAGVGHIALAEEVADVVREEFTGTDGVKHHLRAATAADIDNVVVGISQANRPDRKSRVENGFFGVFIIEATDGSLVRSLFTGRMPIAVQPWPCDEASPDHKRLSIIVNFYDWLLGLQGVLPAHANVVRNTALDVPVMLINNDIHAATVVIPAVEPFNTVAVQDAVARLSTRLGYRVAPDADITPAGIPSFIISATTHQPVLPEGTNSKIFQLPYYPSVDGMRSTTVTRMDGGAIPALPEAITALLAAYSATLE